MILKETARSTYMDVSKIDWEPTRFPGVWTKKLYEEPSGRLTSLTKMEPGAPPRPPARRHRAELCPRGHAGGRGRRLHRGQLRVAAGGLRPRSVESRRLRRPRHLRQAERVSSLASPGSR